MILINTLFMAKSNDMAVVDMAVVIPGHAILTNSKQGIRLDLIT